MLGARIAALRRHKGMSQEKLAQALGVSPSAVGMYEQGRREPSGAMLVTLARLFGVSTDYLLTGQVNPAEQSLIRELLQPHMPAHRTSLSAQELAVLLTAVLTNP